MSKNLVIGSYDEISSLIHKTAETVTVRSRVEPATEEEKALDGQLDILSSLTMHCLDEETGILKLVQIKLASKDEQGNETNEGNYHCSFGGKLESTDILVEGVTPDEEGNVSYEFTLEDFLDKITAKSKQAAEELLGVALNLEFTAENVVVFQTSKTEQQNATLVVSALIPVTAEQLDEITATTEYNKEVVHSVAVAEISVGDVLLTFNLDAVINQFIQSLIEERGVDPLSANNIRLCMNASLNRIMIQLDYETMREAFKARRARGELNVSDAEVVSE